MKDSILKPSCKWKDLSFPFILLAFIFPDSNNSQMEISHYRFSFLTCRICCWQEMQASNEARFWRLQCRFAGGECSTDWPVCAVPSTPGPVAQAGALAFSQLDWVLWKEDSCAKDQKWLLFPASWSSPATYIFVKILFTRSFTVNSWGCQCCQELVSEAYCLPGTVLKCFTEVLKIGMVLSL